MVQNSGNDTAEFRAVFGSMAYQQVLSRMCTGLPAGLDYSLSVSALEPDIFMTKFTGQQSGLTVIDYRQKINIPEKIAYQGDMTIDPDLQQNHAGTYLSCNNLLLRRACGVEKSKFQTDFMGGYAWQRMGALTDTDVEVAGKLEDAKRSIRSELDYLQRRLGLTPAMPDLDRADGLWAVADIGQRGFLDRLNGFFNRAADPGFEIWDTLDHRLTARAVLMKSTYLSDPPQISIGQLVLYGKKIPCYFDLQGGDQNAQRQWQRIRNYMAAKAYPALDSI